MSAVENFLLTVDWGEVRQRMVSYASARFPEGSNQDLQDLVHDAVRQLLKAKTREWSTTNPTEQTLMEHLQSRINGLVINRRRLLGRRGPHVPPEDALSQSPASTPHCDAALEAEDWCYRVLERLEDKQYALEVFCLIMDGTTQAADQAQALGWTITRVYEARRTIRDTIRELRDA